MVRSGNAITYILLAITLLLSCSKENSEERGNTDLPLGNNCKVSAIVPTDSVTGRGHGSFYVTFDSEGRPLKTEMFDSTSGSSYYNINFSYKGDSIEVGENEFFLLDQEKRIREFDTYEVAGDPASDKFRYTYQYDQEGFLKNKNWFIYSLSPDIPSFVYTYTWLNGNLVKVEATEAGGARRAALTADLQYDLSQEVSNFIYSFPEAIELAPFILSINAGKKSKNVLTKIVVKTFDAGGNVINTYNTDYKDYKFSSDGYVTELHAIGDLVDGMLVIDGLTKFKYECK
ncbi:MAG: hypothetical protein ACTHMM_11450 [Agriterribacter sp.]